MPIKAGNQGMGAVPVSGAPGWDKDEARSRAGMAKVAHPWK